MTLERILMAGLIVAALNLTAFEIKTNLEVCEIYYPSVPTPTCLFNSRMVARPQ